MMKFKVGDTVLLDGIKKVIADIGLSAIDSDINLRFVGDKIFWSYNISRLELVEPELIKGKRYEFSDYEDFRAYEERIFYTYNDGFEFPFSAISEDCEEEYKNKRFARIMWWKYIREIQPKYKPYSEPKLEWIGKKVNDLVYETEGIIQSISKIDNEWCIEIKLFCGNRTVGFNTLFNDFTWSDSIPFGEEIKNNE